MSRAPARPRKGMDRSVLAGVRRTLRQSRARSGDGVILAPAEVEGTPKPKTVLFFRHLRRFSGGHLKVWDYYNHVRSAPGHLPYVRFTRETIWTDANPWAASPGTVRRRDLTVNPDIYFLGALDWMNLPRRGRGRSRVPIINFIQGVRHAEPRTSRYRFLSRAAIRVCVSPQVEEAIVSTGRVEGPVFTIPLGISLDGVGIAGDAPPRDVDVLVLANKRPALGARVAQALERPARRVELIERKVPRRELLDRFRRARVSVFLPLPTEGFYMPPLEAMALGTLVVCPDCVGNRSFCLPDHNCFRPDYEEDEIVQAAEAALDTPASIAGGLIERGMDTARDHDLAKERATFVSILERVDELWERL